MFRKLLWIAVLAASPAFAQRGGGGGGGATGIAEMSTPRQQTVSKAVMFANRLDLNNDQREQAQVILTEALKEINQLQPQMAQARSKVVELIVGGGSRDDMEKLMESYSAAAAQVTGIESKAFASICELLKPNQKSKAAPAFDLLAAALDPPGNAGRGGTGRGKK